MKAQLTEDQKAAQWKKAYSAAWDRLFDALGADEKEAVLLSPSGEHSAHLALLASNEADKATA